MNRIILYILLIICTISCNNPFDKNTSEALQGDWVRENYPIEKDSILEEPLPDLYRINTLFTFKADTLFNSNHFGSYNEKTKKYKYLSYKAEFQVKDSMISWFNTITKKNIDFGKVKKFTTDTIYLENFMLIREKKIHQYNDFDAIIVTSSGCYGSCPIYNYRLESNGYIIYADEKFTKINGVYKGTINKEYFNYFKQVLNQIDLKNTDNEYTNNATDGNFEEIVFIKNNKVFKRISFYINDGPPKVKQLLDILRTMNYYIENNKPYYYENYFPILNPFISKKEVDLENFSNYQLFYLWTELMKHPSKKFQFKQKTFKINKFRYKFIYEEISPQSLETIETDGQRFQIKFKNKPIQYYDLGYNFLVNNDLTYK